MPQFMRIEKGRSPWTGVVILNGETHNIWKADEDFYHEDELTEGEAQVEGLKMGPGAPMPAEVDSIKQRINNDYGIDISTVTVAVDSGTVSLESFLRNYTRNMERGMPWYRRPFDIRNWM